MRRALALLSCWALSGCYHLHYVTNAPPNPEPSAEVWHHDFIDGLIEASDPVDVSAICPNGLAEADSELSFLNWLAAFGVQLAADIPLYVLGVTLKSGVNLSLPFTIWTPYTVTVTCASGPPRVYSPEGPPPMALPPDVPPPPAPPPPGALLTPSGITPST